MAKSKKIKQNRTILFLAGLVIVFAGILFYYFYSQNLTRNKNDFSAKDGNRNSGIANPASTNCVDKGGQLMIKDGPKGQYGICTFMDNRQCEEWALFRGDCPVGGVKITGYLTNQARYCVIIGGSYTESTDSCLFKNQVCSAQKIYDGECSFN